MDNMRQTLRRSLGRSLRSMPELDRLEAAWVVAAGRAMAGHGRIVGYEGGVLQVEVPDRAWLQQMLSMRPALERELAAIAAVKLSGIHFTLGRPER